ncbi:hypothetical protein EV126DRAFT_163816 [Verticillium dahliae]|nr:hypothetical protein EV126DRAFT_163816 [Verticillium dahliae]
MRKMATKKKVGKNEIRPVSPASSRHLSQTCPASAITRRYSEGYVTSLSFLASSHPPGGALLPGVVVPAPFFTKIAPSCVPKMAPSHAAGLAPVTFSARHLFGAIGTSEAQVPGEVIRDCWDRPVGSTRNGTREPNAVTRQLYFCFILLFVGNGPAIRNILLRGPAVFTLLLGARGFSSWIVLLFGGFG